jgi:hypothetical protein
MKAPPAKPRTQIRHFLVPECRTFFIVSPLKKEPEVQARVGSVGAEPRRRAAAGPQQQSASRHAWDLKHLIAGTQLLQEMRKIGLRTTSPALFSFP